MSWNSKFDEVDKILCVTNLHKDDPKYECTLKDKSKEIIEKIPDVVALTFDDTVHRPITTKLLMDNIHTYTFTHPEKKISCGVDGKMGAWKIYCSNPDYETMPATYKNLQEEFSKLKKLQREIQEAKEKLK